MFNECNSTQTTVPLNHGFVGPIMEIGIVPDNSLWAITVPQLIGNIGCMSKPSNVTDFRANSIAALLFRKQWKLCSSEIIKTCFFTSYN